ncbi:MAG: hypothetical protein ACR2LK_16905 [Solirubrobacteraceae bacterium]
MSAPTRRVAGLTSATWRRAGRHANALTAQPMAVMSASRYAMEQSPAALGGRPSRRRRLDAATMTALARRRSLMAPGAYGAPEYRIAGRSRSADARDRPPSSRRHGRTVDVRGAARSSASVRDPIA